MPPATPSHGQRSCGIWEMPWEPRRGSGSRRSSKSCSAIARSHCRAEFDSGALGPLDAFAEADVIPEGIDHPRLDRAPRHRLESGPHIAVAFRADLPLERLDTLHHHPDPGTGAAIAVMLAQMQNQGAARDLAVERRVGIEAMIPIDRKSEKLQIKLVRLGDIEDAQDGDDLIE